MKVFSLLPLGEGAPPACAASSMAGLPHRMRRVQAGRMRVGARIDVITDPTPIPAPLPVGEGFQANRGRG
jgi:hypothetical protein